MMLVLLLTVWGCSARPVDNQTFIVVQPGDPIQALKEVASKTQTIIVTGTTLKGGAIANQDVSGWVMMPPSHWVVISAQLEKDKAEGRLLTFPVKQGTTP